MSSSGPCAHLKNAHLVGRRLVLGLPGPWGQWAGPTLAAAHSPPPRLWSFQLLWFPRWPGCVGPLCPGMCCCSLLFWKVGSQPHRTSWCTDQASLAAMALSVFSAPVVLPHPSPDS